MSPLGFHITMRLRNSALLAVDAAAQRRLAVAVLQAARPFELLCFRAADDHLHLLCASPRAEAGELARRVEIALTLGLRHTSGFQPAHFEPLANSRHLRNTFSYVLRQDQHHGFGHDPFAEASNLPDLLGLRLLGLWTTVPVRRRIPRLVRSDLLALLGTPDLNERPIDPTVLADAICAALALPGLHAPLPGEARCAAVHAAGDMPDPALVDAITSQLRLRSNRPPPSSTDPLTPEISTMKPAQLSWRVLGSSLGSKTALPIRNIGDSR